MPSALAVCLSCAALVLLAPPARALNFDFPGPATVASGRTDPMTSAEVPLGPWAAGSLPRRRVEGALDKTAWQIDAPTLTTLQLLAPLREQLGAAGYAVLWECDTVNCGGFDFRYALDVLPEPDMHVDLGDFRFLVAERDGPDGIETISLLVSRSARMGFVQVTQIGGAAAASAAATVPVPAIPDARPGPGPQGLIAGTLDRRGAVALDDLVFATGSADLGPGTFASLGEVADYLADRPDLQVALVGHTDASGDLAVNVALSKSRAASVRNRLIRDYGTDASRVTAEGVGYLSPRASNSTEEGRTLNRRVELVLTAVPTAP